MIKAFCDESVHISRNHVANVVARLESVLGRELPLVAAANGPSQDRSAKNKSHANSVSRQLNLENKILGRIGATKLWRRLGAVWSVNEETATAFYLKNFSVHGGVSVKGGVPLCISGTPVPWSYMVSWENEVGIAKAINAGLRVDIDVWVIEGKLEIGLVGADFSTFLDRAGLATGYQRITLMASDATAVAALIVRNQDVAISAKVEISSLTSEVVEGARPRHRGFVSKSAFDDLAAKLASRPLNVVDVGANQGETVEHFASKLAQARIWALEPHPSTFGQLVKRFDGNDRVTVRNMALGDRNGTAKMYSYTNGAINSLSPVAEGAASLIEGAIVSAPSVEVSITTLTTFCQSENIGHVDVLKLDTQGHEDAIIRGSMDFLANGNVKYILAELIFSPLYAKQAKPGEVISLLEQCGFRVLDLYDFVYDDMAGLKWGDALFEYVDVKC